jgi:AcrR family transcriptional regulator
MSSAATSSKRRPAANIAPTTRKPAQRHRATAPLQKNARRAAILRAAESLLHTAPLGVFSVDALAQRAGVAKGTVYLYFGTREEVLLAVHAERAQRLFDVLERALASRGADAKRLARATLGYLKQHPEFLPLAANCRGMLESNIGVEAALAFKLGVARRLTALGARIEKLFPQLARGTGAALLMSSYGLMLGLWQIAEPPESMAAAMRLPEMRVFRINFEKHLSTALVDLWDGATGRAALRGGK